MESGAGAGGGGARAAPAVATAGRCRSANRSGCRGGAGSGAALPGGFAHLNSAWRVLQGKEQQ